MSGLLQWVKQHIIDFQFTQICRSPGERTGIQAGDEAMYVTTEADCSSKNAKPHFEEIKRISKQLEKTETKTHCPAARSHADRRRQIFYGRRWIRHGIEAVDNEHCFAHIGIDPLHRCVSENSPQVGAETTSSFSAWSRLLDETRLCGVGCLFWRRPPT